MKFRVIDKLTGKEADPYETALHEEWAKELCYCDMDGFALLEDGTLLLVDECGKFEYCDADRFEVVFEETRPHGKWICISLLDDYVYVKCSECGQDTRLFRDSKNEFCCIRDVRDKIVACPYCGTSMVKEEGEAK